MCTNSRSCLALLTLPIRKESLCSFLEYTLHTINQKFKSLASLLLSSFGLIGLAYENLDDHTKDAMVILHLSKLLKNSSIFLFAK